MKITSRAVEKKLSNSGVYVCKYWEHWAASTADFMMADDFA